MNNYKEQLSGLEHEQWSHWTEYMMDNMTPKNIGRWNEQMATDYEDLSEKEKDSDRVWADKVMALNSIKISEYCDIKEKSSHDLFKLFAELTGLDIKRFHDALLGQGEVKG